jgi:glycolate oxidase iron-sulfur subunit
VRFHLNEQEAGRDDMRALIDAWWPSIESGEIEAVVMTASGCGSFVKEYGHHLDADPEYRAKAQRIAAMTRDLSEIVPDSAAQRRAGAGRVAFQSPCSLQHGQQLRGQVEALLRAAGHELTPVADSHLCCGSAGTYSILQPELSARLKANKLAALHAGSPQRIVTANIGCLSHLQSGTALPVEHWIVALERRLADA